MSESRYAESARLESLRVSAQAQQGQARAMSRRADAETRTANALERIAAVLERAFPPEPSA